MIFYGVFLCTSGIASKIFVHCFRIAAADQNPVSKRYFVLLAVLFHLCTLFVWGPHSIAVHLSNLYPSLKAFDHLTD